MRLITVHNMLFAGTVLTNKLSILWFYLRIFTRSPKTRIAAGISMAFFLAWTLACVIITLVGCPPRLSRTKGKPCNRTAQLDNMSALSIFGDVLVLLLPLPAIWNLHVHLHTKIKISFLFLFGIIVTGVAILRCVTVVQEDFRNPEFTINSQYALAYSVLEPNLGIVCANVPMMQIIFTTWKAKFLGHLTPAAEPQSVNTQQERTDASSDTSHPSIRLRGNIVAYMCTCPTSRAQQL